MRAWARVHRLVIARLPGVVQSRLQSNHATREPPSSGHLAGYVRVEEVPQLLVVHLQELRTHLKRCGVLARLDPIEQLPVARGWSARPMTAARAAVVQQSDHQGTMLVATHVRDKHRAQMPTGCHPLYLITLGAMPCCWMLLVPRLDVPIVNVLPEPVWPYASTCSMPAQGLRLEPRQGLPREQNRQQSKQAPKRSELHNSPRWKTGTHSSSSGTGWCFVAVPGLSGQATDPVHFPK
jgi:hypothetical protein